MAKPVEPRQPMPDISLEERKTSFKEIHLGFTEEMAVKEASRCIQCKKPMCSEKGCPLRNKIPQWIALARDRRFMEAAELSRTTSSMPEICSRICPQDRLCEKNCALGIKNDPIAIGALERFINDYAKARGDIPIEAGAPTGKKVAIIGAGPAGMAAAEQLRRFGHEAVIYDAQKDPGGLLAGVLPGFKIDRQVVRDRWALLEKAGVRFSGGKRLGGDVTLDSLFKEGFSAVFVGVGTWQPSSPRIPGIDSAGVVQAIDFLRGDENGVPAKGGNVVILGGGDSAMDCARAAVRRGAASVTIAYRRDEANMPGSKKEVKACKEEGVQFKLLINPVEFLPGPDGRLKAIKMQNMELGEPDEKGRRSPKPVEGSFFELPVDIAVPAFGFKLDGTWAAETLGVELDKWGNIAVNPETGATAKTGVFAGGDCTNGADLAVRAVRAGRVAAAAIDRYVREGNWNSIALGAAPTQEARK